MNFDGYLSHTDRLAHFHRAFGVEEKERQEISWKLIDEEANEVDEELRGAQRYDNGASWVPIRPANVDVHKLAKELADLLYVCYGTALVYGIDLDEAVRLVHKSNMSKLDENGNPIRREDGKVLKGPNYQPPDMATAIHGP